MKRVECRFCGKKIHSDNIASISKKGFSCSNFICIIQLADEMADEKKTPFEVDKLLINEVVPA